MKDGLAFIEATVRQWDGVTAHPHRFGGTEFVMGKVEIGHLHRGGLVDIPFTRKIRDQLIAEGKASHHHVLPDSGWISFWMKTAEDAHHAVWLFRLSYLHKIGARNRRASSGGKPAIDIHDELSRLGLSQPLQSILEP